MQANIFDVAWDEYMIINERILEFLWQNFKINWSLYLIKSIGSYL